MSRSRTSDVVVVGGGLVGAATALALGRAGFKVVIVEARQPQAWREDADMDLRVVALAPSSVRLLSDLDVWAAVMAARVSAYAHMHVWDGTSGASVDFDAASRGQAALGWIVENRLLQHHLWRALATAGVRHVCPARVAGFRVRQNRAVLELDDRSELNTRLLVAADGAGSPLRKRVGIATLDRDYTQRAVVAHVRCERPHQHTAWQRFLPGGPLALLPLVDGRCSIVWSMPAAEARRIGELDDADFCKALGVASDFRLGRVLETTARAAFPLRLQLARRYHAERLVLLGDAAHVVHPLAGQGVNLGLRDVVELRAVLLAARHADRDIAGNDVLARYARRRRSADTIDAWSFDALARVFAWQSMPLVAARALGVRIFDRMGPIKHAFARHAAGD